MKHDTCSKNNRNSRLIGQEWEDAVQVALTEATKTIRGITGIELTDMTARVDPNTGKIAEYHSTVKIAFGVEHS